MSTPPPNPASMVPLGSKEEFGNQLKKLLATGPLYTSVRLNGQFHTLSVAGQGTNTHLELPTDKFRTDCPECKREEWFDRTQGSKQEIALIKTMLSPDYLPQQVVQTFSCRSCHTIRTYWVRFEVSATALTFLKVGEFPALLPKGSAVLLDGMDEETQTYYKKALQCRKFGFGVGAVVYLRKIIEQEIDVLLELIRTRLEDEDSTSEFLAKIKGVKAVAYTPFEDKIALAKDSLPQRLIVDGHNPIADIYQLTSTVIHSLSDDEGVEVFDLCQRAFGHLMEELHRDRSKREEYRLASNALQNKLSKFKKES